VSDSSNILICRVAAVICRVAAERVEAIHRNTRSRERAKEETS
jgi:hypothetical protein